jgi:hypothetical protein
MKGGNVDLTQGKMTAYCAEGADYGSQLAYQGKQQFGTDNGETELDFYGVETIIQNKTGEIVQQTQVASKQLLWGRPANSSGKRCDLPGA